MRKRILKIILCPVILLTRLILCAAAFVTSLAGSVIGLTALLFGILSLMAFVTGSWQNGIAFAVLMLLVWTASLAGFGNLVGTVFPIFGYIGILFIVCICINYGRCMKRKKLQGQ